MTERPDLEKLLALRAEATPGTWHHFPLSGDCWQPEPPRKLVFEHASAANGALIVELVNALPAIADYVRELEKTVQAYKEV